MSQTGVPRASLYHLASLLAFACTASAHSWIEYASRIAPNGTMVGECGYPRGYMPRNETGWKDAIPQLLLPVTGQGAFSGDEIINKYPFTANPEYPMLEATPGDHIALMHFENGHVTLPENQPNKPLNRGTIFFYGTTKPKDQEKLFDIHLRWNEDGTGGDKRGTLLATRNFDDGQCFQANTAPITGERVSKWSDDGAKNTAELPCQSDIQLPADLKPGSNYTIYWYWDWPSLNPDKIDMAKTKNGQYPWAGSFMRGDKVPNGWTMAAIAHNESYASVIDIKIVEGQPQGSSVKDVGKEQWVAGQNIYSKAIKEQMNNNFQVTVDGHGSVGSSVISATSGDVSVSSPSTVTTLSTDATSGDIVTVTSTITVPPTTLITTVSRTLDLAVKSSTLADDEEVVTVTKTTHVQHDITQSSSSTSGSLVTTANSASISSDLELESAPSVTATLQPRGRHSFRRFS